MVTKSPSRAAVKVTSDIVKITPTLAADWLGRNSHNRPIRQRAVDDLAAAIRRGEWTMNGDAIRFGADGALQDGQHRLWAIVEADVAVESLVVKGLPAEAQESMDLGQRRSLKDVLVLRGETSGINIAALLNYHWRFVNGHARVLNVKPTIPQALAHFDAHPGLREANAASQRLRKRLSLSPAMLGTFIYEARAIDTEAADYFCDTLESGANLDVTSPIYVLRRQLEQQTLQQGHPARGQLITVHALFIKAWNAYRLGEQVERLSWRIAGANPEPFPVMV